MILHATQRRHGPRIVRHRGHHPAAYLMPDVPEAMKAWSHDGTLSRGQQTEIMVGLFGLERSDAQQAKAGFKSSQYRT
jgi:hypothetical protein